jgi:ribosomal protein S13
MLQAYAAGFHYRMLIRQLERKLRRIGEQIQADLNNGYAADADRALDEYQELAADIRRMRADREYQGVQHHQCRFVQGNQCCLLCGKTYQPEPPFA